VPIVLDPAFLKKLERLSIIARRTLKGIGRGERRSKRHGGTVEFADYRSYAAGDDVRAIDWHAYARLEQLFLKLYVEEQDLSLHLLLDRSASMSVGGKLEWAARALAALGWIALSSGDRVSVAPFAGGERARALGPLRGRGRALELLRFLEDEAVPGGETSLRDMARTFVARRPTSGVVVLASDFMDPSGADEALERLRWAGHETFALHVVAPDEEEPAPGPDLELEDAETGRVVAVSLDRSAVEAYRERWRTFVSRLESFCLAHEVGYARVRTDVPVEDAVLRVLGRSLVA
jgi:uncharacterized protein (DUF58 family)